MRKKIHFKIGSGTSKEDFILGTASARVSKASFKGLSQLYIFTFDTLNLLTETLPTGKCTVYLLMLYLFCDITQ